MEYQQHEVSGRNDSNKLYNLNFNDTTHGNGNHNNNAGTNPSQGGESNKAHGDGGCNESGGTQGGADNSGNDYDNQNDESSYCYDFGLLYNYKFVLAFGTEQVINNLQSLTELRDQVRFCFDELKSATH